MIYFLVLVNEDKRVVNTLKICIRKEVNILLNLI